MINKYTTVFLLFTFLSCHAVGATIEITVKGIEEKVLQDNIRAFLSLEQQKNQPNLSANRIKRLHQQAPAEIQQALRPFGYYRAQVITHQLQPPEKGQDTWRAHYGIELGQPLRLQTLSLNLKGEGKDDATFQALLATFPLKEGAILDQLQYEMGKKRWQLLAQERGYFDAHFTQHTIQIDEQAYTADIVLTFATGTRYRFGPITFEQDTFDDTLLTRFLSFKAGDFYTNSQLLTLQNDLVASHYFTTVEVDSKPITAQKIVAVNVNLIPYQADKFSVTAGYGTDTGARGGMEWERRYINRWGHRFEAALQLSEVRNSATARYLIPTGKIKEDYWTMTAGYRDETTDTSESELFLIGLNKNQLRSLFSRRVHQIVGIEYRDEIYQIGSYNGHAKLLIPHFSLTYAKADNRIDIMRGQKLQFDLRGAQKSLGSNTSFLQARLSGIFIRPFSKRGRIIARGEIGHTATPAFLEGEFNQLPPSIRFFAGGDRSVRGYDYQSLGPKNAQGDVIGGENLLIGSLEYEHRIFDKWGLAGFYDVGNAFDDFSTALKQGAGIGVRWRSPVGAVQVDIAVALSEVDHPVRLHITVGPDF